MGWQWVNNTANTVPSSEPAIPEWLLAILLFVVLIAGTFAVLRGIIKAIEAFFDWFAGLIADKVVQKMKEEGDA